MLFLREANILTVSVLYLYAAFSQLEYSCLKVALLFPESRKARTGTLSGEWALRWHRGGLTLLFHLRKDLGTLIHGGIGGAYET